MGQVAQRNVLIESPHQSARGVALRMKAANDRRTDTIAFSNRFSAQRLWHGVTKLEAPHHFLRETQLFFQNTNRRTGRRVFTNTSDLYRQSRVTIAGASVAPGSTTLSSPDLERVL